MKKIRKFIKTFDRNFMFSVLKNTLEYFRYLKYLKYYFSFIKDRKGFTYFISDLSRNDNALTALCEKYGSDKGSRKAINPFPHPPHTYTDFYDRIYKRKKGEITKVFECGIGTNDPSLKSNMGVGGKPGASLRAWRDYFKNAQIYGADIDREILFNDDRIKTFYVDQTNKQAIGEMWENIGENNFDIIIDDGLHAYDANICFFENSIDFLSKNGIYVIEDILLGEVKLFREYFKKANFDTDIVDICNPQDVTNNRLIVIKKLV